MIRLMEPNEKHIILDIKTGALLKVVGLILLVALLYFVRDLVVILLAALILAAVINPWPTGFKSTASTGASRFLLHIY